MEEETPNYTQMGIAALIPGAQYMVTEMEKVLDKLRTMLATAKQVSINYEEEAPRKPRKKDRRGSYWQDLTPEERSVEMKRRMAKTRRMQAAKAAKDDAPRHPSDPRHPGHDHWIESLRASQKKFWARKSKAARKSQAAKMAAAKAAKRAERTAA